jgi:hypothetical protein
LTDFDDNEKSDYNELIRELRELKKFIEDGESDFEDDAESLPNEDSGPAKPPGAESGERATRESKGDADSAVPRIPSEDDEPPTLREAIHRPERSDEMQLDLLSVKPSSDPAAGEGTAEDTAPPLPTAVSRSPARGPDAEPGADATEPDGKDVSADTDDEVLMFVLDLSDRILNAIEDRLLERNGEILPGDLRDELRDSIGDILYEWCER